MLSRECPAAKMSVHRCVSKASWQILVSSMASSAQSRKSVNWRSSVRDGMFFAASPPWPEMDVAPEPAVLEVAQRCKTFPFGHYVHPSCLGTVENRLPAKMTGLQDRGPIPTRPAPIDRRRTAESYRILTWRRQSSLTLLRL